MLNKAQQLRSILGTLAWGIATLSLIVSACQAQHYSFTETSKGIDNLDVDCIAQDISGYLWVGTENGLYRYDGNHAKKFGAELGLNGRTVENLFAGRDGTLLVGTTTGIYFRKHNGNFGEIRAPGQVSQLSQRIGSGFTEIAPGQVAIADRSGAYLLRHTSAEQWTAEPMHLEGGAIWSVLATSDGALWYGCGSDLCRLAGGKTKHMGAELHLPADNWLHLLAARDGNLWIRGTQHLGEVIPAESRYAEHDLPGHSNAVPYEAMTLDAQGRITVSQGSAFGLWEQGHWHMITAHNGLSRLDISTLFDLAPAKRIP